jgi:hypothetical protein
LLLLLLLLPLLMLVMMFIIMMMVRKKSFSLQRIIFQHLQICNRYPPFKSTSPEKQDASLQLNKYGAQQME